MTHLKTTISILLGGLSLLFSGCADTASSSRQIAKLHTVFVSQEASDDATYVLFFTTEPIKTNGGMTNYCAALKRTLVADGYAVTDERAKADCIIRVKAPGSIFRHSGDRSVMFVEPHCGLVAFVPHLAVTVGAHFDLALEEAGTGQTLFSASESPHGIVLDERYHSLSSPHWKDLTAAERQQVLDGLIYELAGCTVRSLRDLHLLVLRAVPVPQNPPGQPAGPPH